MCLFFNKNLEFGTSYSNKHVPSSRPNPVDKYKIDLSFINRSQNQHRLDLINSKTTKSLY